MKPIADVVNAISGVINGVTLPAREKKELQAEILRLVYEREREMIEARAGVIRAEATGNWLQRSWRPLVMDLLEIGLGGYVVGRSGEKMAGAIFKIKDKNGSILDL